MTQKQKTKHNGQQQTEILNIVDLLTTNPTSVSFQQRVKDLVLPAELEKKVIRANGADAASATRQRIFLTREDENTLSTEVLLLRHSFTEQIFRHPSFRQAAITVIQNIYLFRQRKIFFGTVGTGDEKERQEALYLLTLPASRRSVPLAKTFQHLILSRIWSRINSSADPLLQESQAFLELHETVVRLNTIRNIYMLLSRGLVATLTGRTNRHYGDSFSAEDRKQIGSFGVARAAYRYHHSLGIRFSTYAGNWIAKELQRQTLANKLIKVSAASLNKSLQRNKVSPETNEELDNLPFLLLQGEEQISTTHPSPAAGPAEVTETKELICQLKKGLQSVVDGKQRDILLRKFGLPPYPSPQPVLAIARYYGVTRGSIYQLEQAALKKLRLHLEEG